MATVREVGKSTKLKVYRNVTNHCYVGRPLTIPKWVTMECCPPDGRGVGLGPHDEEWCEDGRVEMMLNNSQHHQVCILGTQAEVDKEMEHLNVVPLGKKEDGTFMRRMRCESPDGKLVAYTFHGIHTVLTDVTEEKAPAIERGGSRMAAVHVAEMQDELSRERAEKEALSKKLAALEEKELAEKHRMDKSSKVRAV